MKTITKEERRLLGVAKSRIYGTMLKRENRGILPDDPIEVELRKIYRMIEAIEKQGA